MDNHILSVFKKLEFLLLIILGCGTEKETRELVFLNTGKELLMINSSADSVDIAWNETNDAIESFSYDLFFRKMGDSTWASVATTKENKYTLHHSKIGNGFFEFAVKTKTENGIESKLHTSADTSTSLPGGWFLNWNR
ncbi:MAG: hypothetical protein GX640_24275 [Fibrobacter sp.]|nr:hypothetical protein [Fibrobacter sp.]